MAGGTNVLREFLIKIGFAQNETQKRNFQETMRGLTKTAVEVSKGFAELGKSATAGVGVVGVALAAAARPLEALYFAAQRTGASAKELQTFSFAAEQVGVSAEAAQGAIEALAAARRMNPGLNGQLAGLGVDPRETDNAKVFVSLMAKLHAMPEFLGARMAGNFGIDQSTFLQLDKNLPELQKRLEQREKLFKATGVDPDKADKQAYEVMVNMRLLGGATLDLTEIVATRLMPMAEEFISWLQNVVIWLAKADTATGGWSSKLIGLASIVTGGSIAKGAFGLLGKMLGGGGGAAAAGGSSLLPYAGLLGVIGAGAAVTFNSKARDAWDKIAMPYADKALSALGLSADQQGKLGQKLIDFQNSFSKSGIAAGLTAMVAKFEGHVKGGYGTYRDIGGKLTAGFGHLVRPGEDFSHLDKAGALTLLAKDLQGAMASVAKLVKTHLTGNQASALDDFVFNVGEAKFAKSTLLRMLNSGDFAGAADQFQRWNQALVNGHYVVNQGLSDRRAAEAQLFRSGDKGVVISQKTDIHVDGNGDTARQVAREQGRVNGDLVRNFATATQ